MFVQGQVYSYVDTPVLDLNMKYFFFFSRLKKTTRVLKSTFLMLSLNRCWKGWGRLELDTIGLELSLVGKNPIWIPNPYFILISNYDNHSDLCWSLKHGIYRELVWQKLGNSVPDLASSC